MSFQDVALDVLIEPATLERARDRDLPILSMTMHEGLVDQGVKFKKRVASANTNNYKLVRRNQLVVGFPIDEGVLSFQKLYDEAIVSPAYGTWRLRANAEVEPAYLERFLRSPRALAFYRAKLRGTTARRRALPRDVFLRLTIPLPPLAEQKRIARILDAADALRTKRREALAQLDTLIQSTFLDVFGDPVTNPKGLDVELLGELIAMGPQNGLYKPERNYGSGVRILRIDGFYGGAVNDLSTLKRVDVSEQEIQKYGLSESDFVINRVNSRSHLGKSALIPDLGGEPVVFESNMMRLAVDSTRVSPFFMIHFLQTSFIRNQILRSAKDSINQASINQGDVKELRILVPSGDSQRHFVSIAESIERQKASQRAHLAELDTLFASLQSRAFRGDL